MKYDIFGPFIVPKGEHGLVHDNVKVRNAFWDEVEEHEYGLSGACGCYIISVRNRVWYVGATRSQGFCNECFTSDKITKLNIAMRQAKGKAQIHFIARRTKGGRFSKPSLYLPDIVKLETMLIECALERNNKLLNKKDATYLRGIEVPGLINCKQGKGCKKSVQSLRIIMGV